MIIDSTVEFCNATALPTSTSSDSVLIGNVVDTNPIGTNTLLDWGSGAAIYFVLIVTTAVAGVSATTTFNLATDSTANLATSRTNHITTPALATATLVKGYTFIQALPPTKTYERYMGVWATVATATLTAGKVNAFLTKDPAVWNAYKALI
jgi:hypothetical protein